MKKIVCLIIINLFFTSFSFAENTEIRICRPNNMVSALFYIAEAKNLFESEGLTPQFETATNGKLCQDALLARKVDFIMTAEGPFTYISNYQPPVKILAVTQVNPETAVFARKDRGINSFADLKDKRVGYLPGTISYFFLSRVLAKNNLSKDNLKLAAMQPPTMPAALIGGNIDAFVMWEPWGAQAGAILKDNFVILEATELYEYLAILLGHQEIIDQNPQMVTKLLKVLQKASKEIQDNPEESFQTLSAVLKFDQVPLRRLWNKYQNFVRADPAVIDLIRDNFKILQAEDANFQNVPMPDLENFLDFSFLEQIESSK